MRKTQTNKNSVHWAMGKEKILAFTLLIPLMWVIPVYAFDFSDWEVLIKKHVRPKTVDGILINAVDYKNLKNIFNKCNLRIKKILLKSFVECSFISNKDQKNHTFFLITINENKLIAVDN